MKISFCTSICNRLHQLSQTFDHNVSLIQENPDTEWVILNFGSDDGLHEFMLSKLEGISQRIIYANETSKRKWHMSAGKNSSHFIATGDILVNLDCDNYIHNDINFIRQKFSSGVQIMRTWTGIHGDGTCGRVLITKSAFEQLGGYDEKFYPAGYQDIDFFERAVASNFKYDIHISAEYKAIINDKEDTVKNTGIVDVSWKQMNIANQQTSLNNIKNGILKANQPDGFYIPQTEIFRGVVA